MAAALYAASEYISFYQSLPNHKQDNDLNRIKEEAEKQRSNWSYKAEEFGRGLIGMEHHEDYAKITSRVAEYVPYLSDARYIFIHGKGLFENWNKFQNNEDVNSLQLGIDGVGLAASLYGLIPGAGHAADPVKTSTAILRKCVGIMKSEVKNYVLSLFKIVFAYINKSGLLNINAKNLKQLSELVEAKKDQFGELINLANGALKQLQPLLNLAANNWDAAMIVMENAANPEELNNYIHIVTEFDKNNKNILKYGGANALKAAVRLEEKGNLNIDEIINAMAFGTAGLEAVGHIPSRDFSNSPLKSKSDLSMTRIVIIFIFGIYALLALIKIWRPKDGL